MAAIFRSLKSHGSCVSDYDWLLFFFIFTTFLLWCMPRLWATLGPLTHSAEAVWTMVCAKMPSCTSTQCTEDTGDFKIFAYTEVATEGEKKKKQYMYLLQGWQFDSLKNCLVFFVVFQSTRYVTVCFGYEAFLFLCTVTCYGYLSQINTNNPAVKHAQQSGGENWCWFIDMWQNLRTSW